MPSITIGDGQDEMWMVARWAFCGYLEHVKNEVEGDQDLELTVDRAIALDGLHLTLLDESILQRLVPVLCQVADQIVAGRRKARVEGRGVLDERSQTQFREAVEQLRGLLQQHLPSKMPT